MALLTLFLSFSVSFNLSQLGAMKTVNTQLASWTELRHNTVLYTEQSYTPIILCLYPKGYIEPRLSFWTRVREMALDTRAVLATLSTNGVFSYTHYTNDALGMPVEFVVTVSGATMYSNRLAVMDQFVSTMDTLRSISEKSGARRLFPTQRTCSFNTW